MVVVNFAIIIEPIIHQCVFSRCVLTTSIIIWGFLYYPLFFVNRCKTLSIFINIYKKELKLDDNSVVLINLEVNVVLLLEKRSRTTTNDHMFLDRKMFEIDEKPPESI